ncbi:MAG: hypothetical protein ACTSX8_04325 [Alphaproteobacteria bacterium]
MQKQPAPVTNRVPVWCEAAEELGPDGENKCFKVNGSRLGRIRNNKLSRGGALD